MKMLYDLYTYFERYSLLYSCINVLIKGSTTVYYCLLQINVSKVE